jgi:hypothetical protein
MCVASGYSTLHSVVEYFRSLQIQWPLLNTSSMLSESNQYEKSNDARPTTIQKLIR